MGQMSITEAKYDVTSATAPSTRWIYGSNGTTSTVFHYTFNTPVGVPDQRAVRKGALQRLPRGRRFEHATVAVSRRVQQRTR